MNRNIESSHTHTDGRHSQQTLGGYTVDNFVVASSNRFAHAATMAVIEAPGRLYNPLHIYGETGIGKTHLLRAIEEGLRKATPTYKVAYIDASRFYDDLVR